jgi:small subunit ribosomal protein S19e
MGINDVNPQELVERLVPELRKLAELKAPAWTAYAKTGSQAERPPLRPDWWHVRAASILYKLWRTGPIGTSKLRVKYGGRKSRGSAPERFRQAGGNAIRKILQQLEKAGLAKQAVKGVHKGRSITPQGVSLLEKTANALMQAKGFALPKKSDVPPPPPKAPRAPKKAAAKKAEAAPAEAAQAPAAEAAAQPPAAA